MTAQLLGSKEESSGGQVCGNMTSGGTESILLAVKSSRDYMKSKKRISYPEMWVTRQKKINISMIMGLKKWFFRVIPLSAHSAYDKAAQYFGIKVRRVGVTKDFRADVKETRRHINGNTILVSFWLF